MGLAAPDVQDPVGWLVTELGGGISAWVERASCRGPRVLFCCGCLDPCKVQLYINMSQDSVPSGGEVQWPARGPPAQEDNCADLVDQVQ